MAVQREQDGEGRPVVVLSSTGFEPQGAVVFFDQPAADPQAEAGAEILLGGEKGFEEVAEIFLGDAGTLVGDADHYIALMSFHLDVNFSAGAAGVDGIGDKVGHDLANFTGNHAGYDARFDL